MISFGPVPSRRLGQSLGINNIPPKVCTYSCVYCQVGKTQRLQMERCSFYRPDRKLKLSSILNGMLDYAKIFPGKLVTETMLVEGMNIDSGILKELAGFIPGLKPSKAYLAIPTRPPAENWVRPPAPEDINVAFQIFHEKLDQVEYLIGYEGNAFAFSGDVEEDMLNIASVHPMREDAVIEFLKKANADWSTVEKLIAQGRLLSTDFQGHKFYLRNIA